MQIPTRWPTLMTSGIACEKLLFWKARGRRCRRWRRWTSGTGGASWGLPSCCKSPYSSTSHAKAKRTVDAPRGGQFAPVWCRPQRRCAHAWCARELAFPGAASRGLRRAAWGFGGRSTRPAAAPSRLVGSSVPAAGMRRRAPATQARPTAAPSVKARARRRPPATCRYRPHRWGRAEHRHSSA